jgi:CRISPR type I-E-associated protein CasB/Cse2
MIETEKKEFKGKLFIKRLSELKTGELAILRRCNRNPLEDERLFTVLGKLGILNRYEYALTACLYAVYHKADEKPIFIEYYNFGESFKKSYDPTNDKNDIRFRSILTADKGDALSYRLRQTIRLIRRRDEPIDFSILLGDLYGWERTDKKIQRKWAKGYYKNEHQESELPDEDKQDDESNEEDND